MKKSIKTVLLFTLLLTFSANAQNWFGKKVKGNGNEIKEVRNTDDYDAIKIAGIFDVELKSGKEGTITVEAEENLMQYIVIEVKDNVLKVYSDKTVNLMPSHNKKIFVTIPFVTINALTLSGSGDLKSKDTIKSEKFNVLLSGSGEMKLAIESNDLETSVSGSGGIELMGSANDFNALVSGSGDISANQLVTKNTNVTISGSATVHINCTENLKARVSGSGDVFYVGNPKNKDTKVSGSGNIQSE